MKVTRKIWPVGQGAFYTERISTNISSSAYTAVYDCGSYGSGSEGRKSSKGTYTLPTSLEQSINSTGKDIDIIFISHFHWDHINGIESLLKQCSTSKKPLLVIPYLNDDLKLTYFVSFLIDSGIGKAIATPTQSNNEEVYRTNIEIAKNCHSLIYGKNKEHERIEVKEQRVIKITENGNKLDVSLSATIDADNIDTSNKIWYYIPFIEINDEFIKESSGFRERLRLASSDLVEALDNDGYLSINDIDWKTIKDCYDITFDKNKKHLINDYPMMLYSGTPNPAHTIIPDFSNFCRYWRLKVFDTCKCKDCLASSKFPSALYTGDKIVKSAWSGSIKSLFDSFPFTINIGLYQISHHGHGNDFILK